MSAPRPLGYSYSRISTLVTSLSLLVPSSALQALCEGLKDKSPLFRHEVAYVLGQLQVSGAATNALISSILPTSRRARSRALSSLPARCLCASPARLSGRPGGARDGEWRPSSASQVLYHTPMFASSQRIDPSQKQAPQRYMCARCLSASFSPSSSQVRHEAAEALGAIGDTECVEFLRRFEGAEAEMLRESCQVGLNKRRYLNADA